MEDKLKLSNLSLADLIAIHDNTVENSRSYRYQYVLVDIRYFKKVKEEIERRLKNIDFEIDENRTN